MKRAVFTALGILAVSLGAIGIALPVLPTTPFILAAAACFSAGSPRMHEWLLKTKHFGPYIDNYENGRGIPRSLKYKTLAFLWIMLAVSMFFTYGEPWITVLLIVIGVAVSVHVLTIKSKMADHEES